MNNKKSFLNLIFKYNNFKKKELYSNFYKSQLKDFIIEKKIIYTIYNLFFSKTTFYSKIRLKCHINFKSRAILKKFMLNRISFKKLASIGSLQGIKKASW